MSLILLSELIPEEELIQRRSGAYIPLYEVVGVSNGSHGIKYWNKYIKSTITKYGIIV